MLRYDELEFQTETFQMSQVYDEGELPRDLLANNPMVVQAFYEPQVRRLFLNMRATLMAAKERREIKHQEPETWWDCFKRDNPRLSRFLRLAPPRYRTHTWTVMEIYPNLQPQYGSQFLRFQYVQERQS